MGRNDPTYELRHRDVSGGQQQGSRPSHQKVRERMRQHTQQGRGNHRLFDSRYVKQKSSLPPPKSRKASWFRSPEVCQVVVDDVPVTVYLHGSADSCLIEVAEGPDYLKGWQSTPWCGKGSRRRALEQLVDEVSDQERQLKINHAKKNELERAKFQEERELTPSDDQNTTPNSEDIDVSNAEGTSGSGHKGTPVQEELSIPSNEETPVQEEVPISSNEETPAQEEFPTPNNEETSKPKFDTDDPLEHLDLSHTTPSVEEFNAIPEAEIDEFLDSLNSSSDPHPFSDSWLEAHDYELSMDQIKVLKEKTAGPDTRSKGLAKALLKKYLEENRRKNKDRQKENPQKEEDPKNKEDFPKQENPKKEPPRKSRRKNSRINKLKRAVTNIQKDIEEPIKDYKKQLNEEIKQAKQTIDKGKEKIAEANELKKQGKELKQQIKSNKNDQSGNEKAKQALDKLQTEEKTLRQEGIQDVKQGRQGKFGPGLKKKALKAAGSHLKDVDAWGANIGAAAAREMVSLAKGSTRDGKQAAWNVTKQTVYGQGKQGVKKVVYEVGKKCLKEQAPKLAKKVPGLNVCSYAWDAACVFFKAETNSGAAVREGLAGMDIGINAVCMGVGQTLIPVPFVGAAIGAGVGSLISMAANQYVLETLKANGLLPEELNADLSSMNFQYVDTPFPQEVKSAHRSDHSGDSETAPSCHR